MIYYPLLITHVKAYLLSCVLLLSIFTSAAYSQEETRTILLNKEEYRYLIAQDILVPELAKVVFGPANKQNYYKLNITQVDAWTSKILQFKYYPGVNGDLKKTQLNSSINNATENTNLKLNVVVSVRKLGVWMEKFNFEAC